MATFEPKVAVNISLSGSGGIYKPIFSALFATQAPAILYFIHVVGSMGLQ